MVVIRVDADWGLVEKEYVHGVTREDGSIVFPTLKDLAAKHGVSYHAVLKRAKDGDWGSRRERVQERVKIHLDRLRADQIARSIAGMDLIFFETSMRLALLLGEHVDLLRQKTSQGELVRSSEFYNISLALKSAYEVSKASLEGDDGKAKPGGGKASKSSSSKSRSVTEVKEKAAKDLMKKLMKEKTEKRKPRVIEHFNPILV